MRTITFTVPPEYDGKKLIHFLRGSAKLSARLVTGLKRCEGGITRGGMTIRTIDRISAGDEIVIRIADDKAGIEPVEYPLDIIYEDDDLLIINKPAGLAMHPTHNHQGDTLANAVTFYRKSGGRDVTFRAVGRLDKGTSGVVVCALNSYVASRLSGRLCKKYYAVVGGELSGEGRIDAPIYRPDPMKTLRACRDGAESDCVLEKSSDSLGKSICTPDKSNCMQDKSNCTQDNSEYAVTNWRAIRSSGGRTLLLVTPETGRTHQIRVHFAHIGHPLAGDSMYGGADGEIGHQLLHCGEVEITHPVTGERMCFEAPLPEIFDEIMKR